MGAEAQPRRPARLRSFGRPRSAPRLLHAEPAPASPFLLPATGCDELLQEYEARQPNKPSRNSSEHTDLSAMAPPPVASGSAAEEAAAAASKPEAAEEGAGEAAGPAEYKGVTGVKRQHGEVQGWVVELSDGQEVHVDNATLRQQAPQLLLDFYESRLQFS